MQRRDFLFTSTASLATVCTATGIAAVSTSTAVGQSDTTAATGTKGDRRAAAQLRMSSQLRPIPGDNTAAKMAQMKKWGFVAVELGGLGDDYREQKKMATDNGLEISAVCWGSCKGDLCSDDTSLRQPGIDKLKQQLERAGEIGSTGVIYVPAFNREQKLTNQEIRALLLEFLPPLSEFAASVKTHVILEPLNRGEAFFLRQVADGASIARDCNRKARANGISVMGDFYHMYKEETDDMGAFISAGPLLTHVHLANGIDRKLPGQQPEHSFVNGFRGLKYIGYDKFVSFECGVTGDPMVEVPKCLDYLKNCWAEA